MPAQHESPHLEFPVLKADYAAIFPLVFLTERSDEGTRARRPAVLQPGQGSMLLSASDSKVEDLAFDNLRLARRATALEDQLHRATNPSHSSLWGLFCTTASEPASSEAPGAAANEELAAKAHENEQLHIAIYEQLRERTHKQRIEAAQRRAALAVLRAEVALLEGAAEKREEAAAAAAAAAAERDAENGAALQKLQQLCLDLRLCCATQVNARTITASHTAAVSDVHRPGAWSSRLRAALGVVAFDACAVAAPMHQCTDAPIS